MQEDSGDESEQGQVRAQGGLELAPADNTVESKAAELPKADNNKLKAASV